MVEIFPKRNHKYLYIVSQSELQVSVGRIVQGKYNWEFAED